jgi:hypothetical protein
MGSQTEFIKNTHDNFILSKGNNKKLEHEYNNHYDLEKKLNVYGNFYDNYNNKLEKNIDDLSNNRQNTNEKYYTTMNIYKHMENKLKYKRRSLIISLIFLVILLILTFWLVSKVLF